MPTLRHGQSATLLLVGMQF